MWTKRTHRMSVLLTASLFIATGHALAQGVNNPGSLPSSFQSPVPVTGWLVIDPNGTPIPVSLNPNGQPWSKNFTGPNGQPFSYPAFAPPLSVQEILQVAPTLPWTDWHEDVGNPGWVWANPPTVLVNNIPIFPTITGVGTSQLNFFFSPAIPVGAVVDIRKDLQYQGIPGTVFTGTLGIHEYPTPEPTSLLLLAGGSVLALKRRARLAV
jgi:hypothetical protein